MVISRYTTYYVVQYAADRWRHRVILLYGWRGN